jgi:hypothetical protein
MVLVECYQSIVMLVKRSGSSIDIRENDGSCYLMVLMGVKKWS